MFEMKKNTVTVVLLKHKRYAKSDMPVTNYTFMREHYL